ncbi:MAG: chromosome segregation protein SMC [Clostridia bacterium]|nr:chromosome segregation protein SMC [Clostridia bacterium]
MYLKRLEMYGFKSFADKTVLDFMPGLTTVIGPNGSGKSNISDCIRWVLGEQSLKSLRGAKSEDIIFAGTQNRKPLGYAEASLVMDNSDSKLPIEYNEVIVTRRIYRSGESGYFINKTPCRLKDVLELFMDTGIGRDGYSIIGQGKIDEILSNKSEDRRHIFEEAAGIVKYRTRKAESEKKLEQTKLNLLRINDIISEIETNIGPLKNQSEKAKKYLSLRDELKNIEVGLFLYNIDEFKRQTEEIIENIDLLETQKVKEDENLNNLQTSKEDLKLVIDNLIEEIERIQNLGFEGNQKKEQYNSEIGIATERISNNKENYERYAVEIEELENRNKELEDEKNLKQEKKKNLYNNKEKFEKELKEKEEELAKHSKTLSDKEIEIESKKKIVQDNIDNKYEIIASLNTEKANLENLNKRETSLKSEIQETISDLDSARANKEELGKNFYTLETSRNSITKNIDSMKEEKDKSSEKLKEFDVRINSYQSEYRIKESRYRFLVETEKEKEGYSKSVKALLEATEKDSALGRGVHGILANLISVDKKYETAIEMTLGPTIQNIVTNSEEEATRLVNYLRDNNLGRASFLPITSVKGQEVTGVNTRGVNGVIGVASDLITTDRKYEGIILNLLGRTVIVEDIEEAVKLAKQNSYKFKIVTLKGDVINPSGAISGGSVQVKTVSILGRGKEIKALEKELVEIKQKIEKVEKEKQDYENSISEILEKFETKQKEAQELEIVYATEKQKIDNIDLEILKLDAKLAKLRQDLANIGTEKKENSNLQENLNNQIKAIDEENETLGRVIEEFTNLNKDNQKYIDDLNFDITNLKISVSSFDESEVSINEMVERIDQDIQNNQTSISSKKEIREKILVDNKELEEKIEEIKVKIQELEKEILGSTDKVEKLKQDRVSKNEKLSNLEKEIEEQTSKIEDIKNHISKLDLKKSKIELELNQVINKMWEEYELTPNNTQDIKKCENPQEVQRTVNSIRSEIRELGSINVDSINEYKEMKERYDFMSEQRLDLEDSSNKLKKVISEMTETMKKQFAEQFKIINKNFGEVFAELFGGGKAELILADEENILECGIEIEVQPPGKKLQNMMLLSGGERAFTAIALLFAILKINPAPFCVLDEIEAALDDVNVYRFAEYLKKFSKDSQFLVITHRKGTMEAADTVYGITMEEKGISKLLSMKLK